MAGDADEEPALGDAGSWLEAENPYEGVDVSELPDWWVDSIEEFRQYGLDPYRPPLFEDGEVVPLVVGRLEEAYDVEIKLMGVAVDHGDAWGVYVDGEVVTTVDRERTAAGHTRYEMTSDAFETAVTEAIGCG